MKKIILLLACIILASACSVQKRHYLKGFYVSHKSKPTNNHEVKRLPRSEVYSASGNQKQITQAYNSEVKQPQVEVYSALGNNPEVKRPQEVSASGELMASVNNYPFLELKPHKKMFVKSVVIPAIKNCNPEAKRPRSEVSSASGGVSALGLKQNKTLPDSGSNKIKRIIGITLIIIGAIILIFAMLFASAPEFADALLGLIIMALIGIGLYILGLLLLLKNRKHKPEIDKITK